jgi:general secretion pathway protein A
MLSNLETEKSKLIQIVLVGQPNLHDLLDTPELEQLRQRVTVRYHLRPLDPGETSAYINHRLRKAAIGAPLVFSEEVTELIGQASNGLPRKINVIADAVLLFGYGEDKRIIDAPLVREVIAELEATGVLATPAPPADMSTREARLALRERQLAEQHRILTEQYRLIKLRESQAAAPAGRASAPPLPESAPASSAIRTPAPLAAAATRAPYTAPPAVRSYGDDGAGNYGLWTRLRRGLVAAGHAAARELNRSSGWTS